MSYETGISIPGGLGDNEITLELLVKDILNNWGEDERDTPAQESPTPDNGHGN